MKKSFVCCILCICIALTGCAIKNTPLSSHGPATKKFADTMGLMEAFTKHDDLKALFVQAASGSMPLADIKKSSYYEFDIYHNGTNAYYGYNKGLEFTDESLLVDKKTADAIRTIRKKLPGVSIWMHELIPGKEGRMCVDFNIVKNTTGKDDGYYEEHLIYSSQDLSDMIQYGYKEIGGGWWFYSNSIGY